jgi:methyl-accepting chemotaxis protein
MLFGSALTQLSVKGRLALGFGSLVALLVIVAAFNMLQMRQLGDRVRHIVEVNNPKTELASEILNSINNLAIHVRTITLLYDEKEVELELNEMKTSEAAYLKAYADLKTMVAREDALTVEKELVEQIGTAANATLPMIKKAAFDASNGGQVLATEALTTNVRVAEAIWRKKVSELIKLEIAENREASEKSEQAQSTAFMIVTSMVAIAVVVGAVLGILITRSVKRPIDLAIAVAEQIASGDLTSEIDTSRNDEIGRLLQAISSMQEKLHSLVKEIRHTAEHIQLASAEVASGNQDLSQRTEQAAANLQLTASSMEKLATTVKQSVNAAARADELATSASAVAIRGGEVVTSVVTTMDEISASSKKISDITGVIDGIAFQTNILALNAAVEAARAGENGRGFAVVATEVRSLAKRSADAAKEIKNLIGESAEKVDSGAALVQSAGTTMIEIVNSVKRVTETIGDITFASNEQNAGIGQVSIAVTELDHVTQQNAALVEESAAAAESLKDQAFRLSELVKTFTLHEMTLIHNG